MSSNFLSLQSERFDLGDFKPTPSTPNTHLFATLQRIDEFSNKDVEMQVRFHVYRNALPTFVTKVRTRYCNPQGPLSEELTIFVLDTNILLEFLEVIQAFVSEVEEQGLPVLLVIPGVVIYELDGQKNREGLSWFARRASTWLLKKVKERRSVKGQALDETCKPSRNWKKRDLDAVCGVHIFDPISDSSSS